MRPEAPRRAGLASRSRCESCPGPEISTLEHLPGQSQGSEMNWKGCEAVESREDKVSGAFVFTGTRIPVAALFENLEADEIGRILGSLGTGKYLEI